MPIDLLTLDSTTDPAIQKQVIAALAAASSSAWRAADQVLSQTVVRCDIDNENVRYYILESIDPPFAKSTYAVLYLSRAYLIIKGQSVIKASCATVIKELNSYSREGLKNIQRETLMTGLLLGETYCSKKSDTSYCVIMPMVPGLNLQQIAGNTQHELNVSLLPRLQLCIAICLSLKAYHDNDFFHGDVKPDNIHEIGELVDFQFSGHRSEKVTGLYSPSHAAPEVLKGKPISAAADVFALGILLLQFWQDPLRLVNSPFTPTENFQAHDADCVEQWHKEKPLPLAYGNVLTTQHFPETLRQHKNTMQTCIEQATAYKAEQRCGINAVLEVLLSVYMTLNAQFTNQINQFVLTYVNHCLQLAINQLSLALSANNLRPEQQNLLRGVREQLNALQRSKAKTNDKLSGINSIFYKANFTALASSPSAQNHYKVAEGIMIRIPNSLQAVKGFGYSNSNN